MTIISYKAGEIPAATLEEQEAMKYLAELPESEIDCSEIPEMTEEELARMVPWQEAKAYRNAKTKQTVTA
jgi:hypothetical protein